MIIAPSTLDDVLEDRIHEDITFTSPDGTTVGATVIGSTEATRLAILAPGFSAHRKLYEHIVSGFDDVLTMIIDLRGQGHTEGIFDLEASAQDIRVGVDVLRERYQQYSIGSAPVYGFGHSSGVILLALAASCDDELFSHLCMLAPIPSLAKPGFDFEALFRRVGKMGQWAFSKCVGIYRKLSSWADACEKMYWDQDVPRAAQRFALYGATKIFDIKRFTNRVLHGPLLLDYVREISCPTLYIFPGHDQTICNTKDDTIGYVHHEMLETTGGNVGNSAVYGAVISGAPHDFSSIAYKIALNLAGQHYHRMLSLVGAYLRSGTGYFRGLGIPSRGLVGVDIAVDGLCHN